MKKRILAFFLCAAMVVPNVPVPAVYATEASATETEGSAAETDTEDLGAEEQPTGSVSGENTGTLTSEEETASLESAGVVEEESQVEEQQTEDYGEAEEAKETWEEVTGSQVGDIIWIKSGSLTFKDYRNNENSTHTLLGNYEVKIKQIITDENGNPAWYEFEFTSLGVGEAYLALSGYKYVKVENTSVEEPEKPQEPDQPEEPEQPEIEEDDQIVDKEAIIGNTSVKIQAVPENVKLSVQEISSESYNEFLDDMIDPEHVVFAYDIALNDVNGNEWQPVDGETVTVILDASSLDLENGDKIGIIHEHEGALHELGEYTVTDGKLTFETSGFSVFYGYTVDFEYDGNWYSITGGTSMYLSELFYALHIDRSVNEVKNVEFSDPTLLSVEHVVEWSDEKNQYWNWQLVSLKAFESEETLTVAFEDGTEILLNVYDASYAGLSNGMALKDGDVISGNITVSTDLNISISGTVVMNGSITVTNNATLTITGNGTFRRGSITGEMFNVAYGSKLCITGNGNPDEDKIIIDGNWKSGTTRAAIYSYGDVTLKYAGVRNNFNQGVDTKINDSLSLKSSSGGGIYIGRVTQTNSDKTVTITGRGSLKMEFCDVTNNLASTNGGGIFSYGSTEISNCEIKNNYAMQNSVANWGRGGGINVQGAGATCILVGVDISGNTCMRYGGGVHIGNGAVCTLYSGNIYNNQALTRGAGGVHVTDASTYTMYGGSICKNTAKEVGGGIHSSYSCSLYLYGGSIHGNTVTGRGGGISIDVGTTLYLGGEEKDENENVIATHKGTTINGNRAETGSYVKAEGMNVSGKTWTQDTTKEVITDDGYGGGIVVDAATCNLVSAVIKENYAKAGGGGFMLTMRIDSNDEHKDELEEMNFEMTGGIIQNNTTDGDGGGFYLDENKLESLEGIPEFEISAGHILNNTAKNNGGGIFLHDKTEFTVTGTVEIKDNEAANGGGIYVNGGTAHMEGGTLSGNTAANNGGAVYVNNTSIVFGGERGNITVNHNKAENGAGFYLNQDGEDIYTTTISNGDISNNTSSQHGGGIYQTGASGRCIVSGDGTISANRAGVSSVEGSNGNISENIAGGNGGALYIAGGSELTVSGGIITGNYAYGTSNEKSARKATGGVGGGVYVTDGSKFVMNGTSVGLHSNHAEFAANDAYASGINTTLDLPNVKRMNLKGYDGTGSPDGWFADYNEVESTFYPNVLENNPGRYDFYDEDKVEVKYDTILSQKKELFYCLTIGTPHPKCGDLLIEKQLDKSATENQTFLFRIVGETREAKEKYSMDISLTIKSGQSYAKVLVKGIPDGTYRVSEDESWSWRYHLVSTVLKPAEEEAVQGNEFTIEVGKTEWEVKFENTCGKDQWLSGDCYVENWWGGTEGEIVKRDGSNIQKVQVDR